MECEFTEEQELFRSSIRNLVKRDVFPRAREIGKQKEIPRDLWKKICDLGLVGMTGPEHYGGQPGNSLMLGIAAEEIGKGDVSLATTLIPNTSFCTLLQYAQAEVQEEWLPPIISGDKLSCVAVTEPDCGADAAAMKMTARREGDHYIFKGEKTSISWGMYAEVATVFAGTDPQFEAKGVSCFLLPLDLSGIEKLSTPEMGLKPMSSASFILDNVRIPKDYLIGQEGEGADMIVEVFDLMRILVALISIGAAERVLDETSGYCKQRIAFGKPIGKFEGVFFKIAEAATLLEAARALCYRALWLRDRGVKHTVETAMCKWWSTKVAVEVIHDALLLHGYFGYSTEALIEQRLRNVIGNQLADGGPEAMKLIIAGELFGKDFLPHQLS
ncbi:MAG: acyl-CoA dehydrogenase family protein [Desulfatiglandales bacterium]|nr:acyl-CoA dehydrogenase family protein [Desulfatiglandales bacterium]